MGYSAEAGLERGPIAKSRGAAFREHRLYKVSYHINLLGGVTSTNGSLIDAITQSHSLDIFQTGPIRDLIDYRWEKFARRVHATGMAVHLVYIFNLT